MDSTEVQVAGGFVCLAAIDVERVRERGIRAERKRARICAHPSASDPLQEMIICLVRETYIRPHRHAGKSESFHIIDGELDVVLFEDDGAIREVIRMGSYQSQRTFFYRLMEPCFHTVLVRTPQAVFHETTNGPFDPADTEYAPWAPSAAEEAQEFQHMLRLRTQS
jgi:cupin fold WbuC family metalloprotein